MATFTRKYRSAFATLGYNLKPRDGCAKSRIDAAAKRLGIRVPEALRDYYLIAGCERRFNGIYNRPRQAVCFLKWDDPIQQMTGGSPWRVFAGASTKGGLEEIANQLKLTWEAWGA